MNAQEANEEPEAHPERTCVGCRQKAERQDLVRFALGPTPPYVAPDPGRRLGGKGASVHPTRACLRLAIARGGFARAARQPVQLDLNAIAETLAGALDQFSQMAQVAPGIACTPAASAAPGRLM